MGRARGRAEHEVWLSGRAAVSWAEKDGRAHSRLMAQRSPAPVGTAISAVTSLVPCHSHSPWKPCSSTVQLQGNGRVDSAGAGARPPGCCAARITRSGGGASMWGHERAATAHTALTHPQAPTHASHAPARSRARSPAGAAPPAHAAPPIGRLRPWACRPTCAGSMCSRWLPGTGRPARPQRPQRARRPPAPARRPRRTPRTAPPPAAAPAPATPRGR